MHLSKTAKRLLTEASESKIGTCQPRGGAGWEGRTRERVAKRLLEQGLLTEYPHDGELEITSAGREAIRDI